MRIKMPYRSLKHTLQMIKAQALEGLPYVKKEIPGKMPPSDLFDYLKERLTYRHDPKGIELVHSPRTLFEDNYHGISGAGDCDDFSMLAIAALKAQGVPEKDINVVLTGRNKYTPKHIYLSVYGTPFDLTNNFFGQERKYPYKQEIPLKLL